MGTGVPDRADRVESVLGSTLALVLLAAVVWALTDGGSVAGISLHAVLG